jgi:uncharacterized membrane protein (DUF4010 family)
MTDAAIWSMLVAILAGTLIGLERERKRERVSTLFAGVRTFALIALLGGVAGILAAPLGVAPLLLAFGALSALVALGYWRESAGDKLGATTGVAALVTFGLGVLAGLDAHVAALAGAVLVTGVLSLREELHGLAGGLTRDDLLAVVRFAAVSLVVLPLVPDEAFGPWGVWNPRTIWLLVVLISGVSFAGYVAIQWVGAKRGIGLSGLLGGLASSTATTLSMAERTRDAPALAPTFAVGTLAASSVAGPRLLVLIGVVRPSLLPYALVPIAAAFAVLTAIGLWVARRQRDDAGDMALTNPFELRPALQFAALFAVIALLVRAAQEWLGTSGVLAASALAGITQLDAIALSLAEQARGGLDPVLAGRALGFAFAANGLFKAVLAWTVGGADLGRRVLPALLVAAAVAAAAGWWGTPWIASLLPPPP